MNLSGAQLREIGMQQATEHADAVCPDWSERAYQFVRAFASLGGQFRTEQVRAYAEQNGLPVPPSARAWGGVIAKAARANIIKQAGFENCVNPAAHRCPVRLWAAV